jgi:cytochrome c oxidase cbb3-type subunit 3
MEEQSAKGGAPAAGERKEGKPEEYIAMGKAEFAARCASCHGADAKGGIGPDLTRREFTYGKDEKALVETIVGGRPGGMPAFGEQLSPAQIEGVVRFILSLPAPP